MGAKDLLIVAGEASGDLHGARLLEELLAVDPEIRAFGLGAEGLRSTGLEAMADSSEISVIGITEALKVLGRAREIFAELLEEVDRRQAATAVLIDLPEFNLRLAKALKRRGVKVAYYISPQVWAWRKGRVRTIEKFVDRMLVVLPFEADFYSRHGVDALYVGHPLVDVVPQLPQIWDEDPAVNGKFHVSLLPGSRRSELAVLLPILLAAGRCLAERMPVRFSLIRAPTVPSELLKSAVADSGLEIAVVADDRFPVIASSHLALCAAGTATLEVGLLGTPMVVTHRVSAWSYYAGRLLVSLRHAALVNLILEREAVPELLQWHAEPERLGEQAARLLSDRDEIGNIRTSLADLRERLGPPGGSRRAAREVLRLLPAAAPSGITIE